MDWVAIVHAILTSPYALQNSVYTFFGLREFVATQVSLHEPLASSCNHSSNISLVFPSFQRFSTFIHTTLFFIFVFSSLFYIFIGKEMFKITSFNFLNCEKRYLTSIYCPIINWISPMPSVSLSNFSFLFIIANIYG